MPLKTLVKVSAVNNLSDARYCAGMGVALLGFPLDPGQAAPVTPEQFKALTQWIEGVGLVGEFAAQAPATIQQVLEQYALDYLQVDYPMAPHHLADLALPCLLRLQLQGHETLATLSAQLAPYQSHVQYFVVEALPQAFHLQPVVHQLATHFPILQSFQVQPAHLPQLLQAPLQGLALAAGTELRPGYKDYEALAEVLERLVVE